MIEGMEGQTVDRLVADQDALLSENWRVHERLHVVQNELEQERKVMQQTDAKAMFWCAEVDRLDRALRATEATYETYVGYFNVAMAGGA